MSFNSTLRLPNYTQYKLKTRSERCVINFKEDIGLRTLKWDDIGAYFGYDKGHLVHAIDVMDSCSTFTMAKPRLLAKSSYRNHIHLIIYMIFNNVTLDPIYDIINIWYYYVV